MKNILLVALLLFSLVASSIFAQGHKEKETIITATGSSVISSTDTDMYGGTSSPEASKLYKTAVEYSNTGDSDNAIKYYNKAIKKDPKFVEAYDNVAVLYRRSNNLEKAIECNKKSIEIYPQGPMAHQNLALIYSIQGNFEASLKEYQALAEINENDPESYFGIANIYMSQQKFDLALENVNKAVEIYKTTDSHHLADGYMLTGYIYFYKEDEENAKKFLGFAKEKGAKLDPKLDHHFFGDQEEVEKEKDFVLETEADFLRYESDVVNGFLYLAKSPVTEKPEQRKTLSKFLVEWILGSPTVSIEISEKISPYLEKSPEYLIHFLGGTAIYQIKTRDLTDRYKSYVAGTELVIIFYNNNKKTLGKNKEIEKLIKLQKKDKLTAFIKENSTK
jgi:tetratricopeptide (TPR) repeat protein